MLNHQYSHPLQQQGQQQPTNTRTLGIGVRATLMMIYILIGVLFSMGVAAQSSDPPIDSTQPLYRLYSPVLGGHVYTPNAAGYSQLSGIGWKPEGPAFRVMKAAGVVLGITAVPLTRLYNAALGRHVMTTDPTQVAAFGAQGWSNEGPRGYIMPSKLDGTVPVFRLYSPFFNSYLYLSSETDRDAVVAAGWKFERTEGYAWPVSAKAIAKPDALRFLTQATFGPHDLEIKRLNTAGMSGWIDDQLLRTAAPHMAYLDAAKARRMASASDGKGDYVEEDSYEAIWQQWLWGNDPLRARMSFAITEIMVISNTAPDIYPEAMSTYMDVVNKNALGNYRDLLQAVTLTPAMGYYLNMAGSEKEDLVNNKFPNQNFAREVLQLFSVGLYLLNPDGTRKLDAAGKTIPTYGEDTVVGFSQAFSGWNFGGNNTADDDKFDWPDEHWGVPLAAWPSRHATGTKKLLAGAVLPDGQSPEKDLKDALDNIFNHPNTPPFISKQLIQRFITSNPSPAFVARIAAVFENNGSGIRGDLGAVIKAILLDAEARDATLSATNTKAGKQREPVIRFANILRAFNGTSKNGRNNIQYLDSAEDALGQSPLLAPSVFNFFSPFYTRSGKLAQAGMVAPEFQITNEIQTIGTANFFYNLVKNESYGSGDSRVMLDLKPAKAFANDPATLVDYLAGLLTFGTLSNATRDNLITSVTSVPFANKDDDRTLRVRTALTLLVLSPDFVIQK